MAGAQLASRVLYPRLGPRRHITIGVTGMAASIGLLALLGPQTSLWWARLLMLTLGLFVAQVFVPVQAASFATITPAATGRASTLFNTMTVVSTATVSYTHLRAHDLAPAGQAAGEGSAVGSISGRLRRAGMVAAASASRMDSEDATPDKAIAAATRKATR